MLVGRRRGQGWGALWHLMVGVPRGHPCPCSPVRLWGGPSPAVGMCGASPVCRQQPPLCPRVPPDPPWPRVARGSRCCPVPPAPPTFTETPPQYVEAKEGSSVTLTCMAFGNPKPIVTWLREGDLLGANGKYQVGGGGLPWGLLGWDGIDRAAVAAAPPCLEPAVLSQHFSLVRCPFPPTPPLLSSSL